MREDVRTGPVGGQLQADAPRVPGNDRCHLEQLAAQRIDLRRGQFGPYERQRKQPLDQYIAQRGQQHAQLVTLKVMATRAGRKQTDLRFLDPVFRLTPLAVQAVVERMMFTDDEIEAIVLGSRMVVDRGDEALSLTAENVLAKIRTVIPTIASDQVWKASLLFPHPLEDGVSFGKHLPTLRLAIRNSQKFRVEYTDQSNRVSTRTVWQLGLYLFSHVTLVCASCEKCLEFRSFRAERISQCEMLDCTFYGKNDALMKSFSLAFLKA
jgi:hypothetical protein